MIELTFLKILTLIRQVHQKSALFATLVFFAGFKFQPVVCNGCHDVLMISIDLDSITILNIHGVDYLCVINGMSKSEAIIFFKKIADLREKNGTL